MTVQGSKKQKLFPWPEVKSTARAPKMKIKELAAKFQQLVRSNPSADVRCQFVEYIGNGTSTTEVAFVDAKLEHGIVLVRVTEPGRVEDVKECDRIREAQER